MALKYGGNPALLVIAGLTGITTCYYVGFNYIKPYFARKKRREAKEFGDFILEQENKTM